MQVRLTFKNGNSKLQNTWTFSLPSGYTCPGARECLAKVPRDGGKLVDGIHAKYRCFSASQEALYTPARKSRWNNLDVLRSSKNMADTISQSLPGKDGDLYRVHISGDFFSKNYLAAWFEVAAHYPKRTFYAYTKSLNFWIALREQQPSNFILTASKGGAFDHLILEHKLKYCDVVFSVADAEKLGLELDHDDTHAYKDNKPFALLLHGTQKAGSEASKALTKLKRAGFKGYSKRLQSVGEGNQIQALKEEKASRKHARKQKTLSTF